MALIIFLLLIADLSWGLFISKEALEQLFMRAFSILSVVIAFHILCYLTMTNSESLLTKLRELQYESELEIKGT